MTTIEDRLKEIAEIDNKIEAIMAYKDKKEVVEQKESIVKLRDELQVQNDLVASVDPSLLQMMSRSSSRSREKRQGSRDETTDIAESLTKAQDRIEEIEEAIDKAGEELEIWKGELEKLEKDLDNVSLHSLEQL
ncbi:hypothetical protein B0T26DRAFT_749320 [Lasiosphaeria miniovina]|uniref:Uncharacterized protein n=1 Tax=Lasiosphaeria miniovina TaxID=1954250 RepID=A0AA40E438_9PEZI|nr:uncharacterized protein B0T26DRAFT_749320 [Lasiosphaeria miniovina]KAK0721848.1 hypothetical protein B0T26DRAFT_749320 [Lasiosphaeria miniovina]